MDRNIESGFVTTNPFMEQYDTPFGILPFEEIKLEHFVPAIEEGMRLHNDEIREIIENSDGADFKNTVARLDYSGARLRDVLMVFHNFNSSITNPELQAIAREMAPKLSTHFDNISLNEQLFKRIKVVYEGKESLNLTPEQNRLLEETYKEFVRGGANLDETSQKRFREINSRLSVLTLQFGENVLNETNKFKLFITDEKDLSGLPQNLIDQAAETAAKEGKQGQWAFTLHAPSVMPFLQYADNRLLREKMYRAYVSRGDQNNENDNKEIVREIVTLRLERARMLGYESHADYILEENMAKDPANVGKLLIDLWKPALQRARDEASEYQALIEREGANFKLEPWDWRYYAEKVRKEKYDLSDEELKPYFSLENVKAGLFATVNKLYGISLKELKEIPFYHPEAEAYEVTDSDGSHLGVVYLDFHPRESKRSGAWMSSFRKQYIDEQGNNIRPVITTVYNFSKPTGNSPALLTFTEANTLFHEFGHALHGLFSNTTFHGLSGTAVPRDFVELPSQILENWVSEPEVLKMFARHYVSGEVLPDELIEKIKRSEVFNQGFETTEYLAASMLDMAFHDTKEISFSDVASFENQFLESIGLIPEINTRYRSTYFSHIFSGGYSAGYYSYIWAAILDSDAFELFKQKGIFNREVANAFRKNILEKGGTEDPMILYKAFRGADPDITPLLRKRGLE